MGNPVKKRAYDASSRRARSDATRQRIIDVARELVVQRGYRATTIADIARGADVNVATVYELVGRKAVLLKELVEQALSGTDHAIAGADRSYVAAMRDEADPAEKLAIYAAAVRAIQARLAPLFIALRDASSTEAEAEAVWREISDRRAENMRLLVVDLAATGRLRRELSIDDAADTIWAMNSSELYVLLTNERGWTAQRFERWLADSWRRLLLADK